MTPTYRFIRRNDTYRIQRKGWFRWVTLGYSACGGYGVWEPHEFTSIAVAKQWLFEHHINIMRADDCNEATAWEVV